MDDDSLDQSTHFTNLDQFLGLPIQSCKFAFIDFETTGGNPQNSDLIEVACVSSDPAVPIYSSLAKPYRRIPHIVRRITGLSNKDVINAPRPQKVMVTFLNLIKDHIIVSHNVASDLPFIEAFLPNEERERGARLAICTQKLAEVALDRRKSLSLQKLGEDLALKKPNRQHRALDDALLTKALFEFLMQKTPVKNLKDLIIYTKEHLTILQYLKWRILNEIKADQGLQLVSLIPEKGKSLKFFSNSFSEEKIVSMLKASSKQARIRLFEGMRIEQKPLQTSLEIFLEPDFHFDLLNKTNEKQYFFLMEEKKGRFSISSSVSANAKSLYFLPAFNRRDKQTILGPLNRSFPFSWLAKRRLKSQYVDLIHASARLSVEGTVVEKKGRKLTYKKGRHHVDLPFTDEVLGLFSYFYARALLYRYYPIRLENL